MALVRCPKHDIPYNDQNPRGCPACALELLGAEKAGMMQEWSRTTRQGKRAAPGTEAPPGEAGARMRKGGRGIRVEWASRSPGPVTRHPKPPLTSPTPLERLRSLLLRRPVYAIGFPLVLASLVFLLLRGRPRFVAQPHPAPPQGEILPLPVEPGQPISLVFGILGVQPPRPHPDSRLLERYSYGPDLWIDVLNGEVYSIVVQSPNRSWRGLHLGMTARPAEGTLALLGVPKEPDPPTSPRGDMLGGHLVYESLDQVPRRRLVAEVRPPNGCFDVAVELKPQVVGVVTHKRREYPAVRPNSAAPQWVVTRVTVINRALSGRAGAPLVTSPARC